jgi:hypothetical protein
MTTMTRRSITIGIIAALLFAAPILAPAATAPIARIVRAEGEVSVKYAGVDSFVSVWRRDRVGAGDTIQTGSDSGAELLFSDGTRIVLGSSATLAVTDVVPRRADDDTGGRIVFDISVNLESGAVRAAAGSGGSFTLVTGGGTITVVSSSVTGADFTAVMGRFAWGEYVSVRAGCVFASGPAGGYIPLCASDGLAAGLRYPGAVPAGIDESALGLAFAGKTPTVRTEAEPVGEIAVDGRRLTPGADGAFHVPASAVDTGGTVTVSGEAQYGRAVVISGAGGRIHETVPADRSGMWEREITLAPGMETALVVETVGVGVPPMKLKGTRGPPSLEETTPAPETKVDPDAVAGRFVRELSGALSRGDTAALSAIIAPDYSGTAGGGSRPALIRGAAEFFRSGGESSFTATAGGAALSGDAVIATMTFAARSGGTTKTGSTKLWLTTDGKLTHAEGEWAY